MVGSLWSRRARAASGARLEESGGNLGDLASPGTLSSPEPAVGPEPRILLSGSLLVMLLGMVLGGDPLASPQVLAIARALLADATTCEVTTALRAARIRSILLKGPTIARWLYEQVSMRPYVDSDLMVADRDVCTAEEVLAGLGFEHAPLDDIP